MTTTKEDIARWFKSGLRQGATHLIVVCDTFDYEDYPVYVMPGEKAIEVAVKHGDPKNPTTEDRQKMQKVMEVYSLSLPMEDQLNEKRAFHYD